MEESSKFCSNCKKEISFQNYATHSAFCERKIKLCERCNEPVPHSDLEKHLQESHAIDACHQCERTFEKWQIENHMQEDCLKRLIACKFCESEVSFDKLEEHNDFCGSRTEKCFLCKAFIMLKDKETHLKLHSYEKKLDIEKSINKEEKQNCVNELISMSPSPQEDSKYFGICRICNKKIRWIDMATHVPTCASARGKCSRCGETVPDHKIKSHVMKDCKLLPKKAATPVDDESVNRDIYRRMKPSDGMVTEAKLESSEKCIFCKEDFPTDTIAKHTTFCHLSTYECPLCLNEIPQSKWGMHEFECTTINGTSHSESSSNYQYQTRKPAPCKFCQKIFCEEEKSHLESCPGLIEGSENRGTIRKFVAHHKKLEMKKCEFCNTTYNTNILPFHHEECINKKKECPMCGKKIHVKDEQKHAEECQLRKGKKKRNQFKHEKDSSMFSYVTRYWMPGHNKNKNGSYHDKGQYKIENYNEKFYNQNAIPCEFCEELFPPDEIIIHETGCKPELACFIKKENMPKQEIETPSYSSALLANNLADKSSTNRKFFDSSAESEISREYKTSYLQYKKKEDINVQPGEYINTNVAERDLSKFKLVQSQNSYKSKLMKNTISKDHLSTEHKSISHIQSVWCDSKSSSIDIAYKNKKYSSQELQYKVHETDLKKANKKPSISDKDETIEYLEKENMMNIGESSVVSENDETHILEKKYLKFDLKHQVHEIDTKTALCDNKPFIPKEDKKNKCLRENIKENYGKSSIISENDEAHESQEIYPEHLYKHSTTYSSEDSTPFLSSKPGEKEIKNKEDAFSSSSSDTDTEENNTELSAFENFIKAHDYKHKTDDEENMVDSDDDIDKMIDKCLNDSNKNRANTDSSSYIKVEECEVLNSQNVNEGDTVMECSDSCCQDNEVSNEVKYVNEHENTGNFPYNTPAFWMSPE